MDLDLLVGLSYLLPLKDAAYLVNTVHFLKTVNFILHNLDMLDWGGHTETESAAGYITQSVHPPPCKAAIQMG